MHEYFALPMVSNIGGSWIAKKTQISGKEWNIIIQQVKDALNSLQSY
jgi:2-keto-3-deoxy-6-phosphogluconate aldolase